MTHAPAYVELAATLVTVQGTPLGPGFVVFTAAEIIFRTQDVMADDGDRPTVVMAFPTATLINLLTREDRVCVVVPGPLEVEGLSSQAFPELQEERVKIVATLANIDAFHSLAVPILSGDVDVRSASRAPPPPTTRVSTTMGIVRRVAFVATPSSQGGEEEKEEAAAAETTKKKAGTSPPRASQGRRHCRRRRRRCCRLRRPLSRGRCTS